MGVGIGVGSAALVALTRAVTAASMDASASLVAAIPASTAADMSGVGTVADSTVGAGGGAGSFPVQESAVKANTTRGRSKTTRICATRVPHTVP